MLYIGVNLHRLLSIPIFVVRPHHLSTMSFHLQDLSLKCCLINLSQILLDQQCVSPFYTCLGM